MKVKKTTPDRSLVILAGMSVCYMEITPSYASNLLEKSADFKNRAVKSKKVEQFASDMASGAWTFTGDTLKLDTRGRVIDGQHRLMACVAANASFWTLVVTGLDPAVAEMLDQGAPRTAGDRLRMSSGTTKHVGIITSAARYFYGLNNRAGDMAATCSYSVLSTIIEDHNISAIVARSVELPELQVLYRSRAVPAALAAYLRQFAAAEVVDAFFLLVSGVGVQPNGVVNTLRNRLAKLSRRGAGAADIKARCALTILAWNSWFEGRTDVNLSWRTGPLPSPKRVEQSTPPARVATAPTPAP